MDGRRILPWTVGAVTCCIAMGILIAGGLSGLVVGIPALYAIPYTIGRIRLSRAMHRELRTMLDG